MRTGPVTDLEQRDLKRQAVVPALAVVSLRQPQRRQGLKPERTSANCPAARKPECGNKRETDQVQVCLGARGKKRTLGKGPRRKCPVRTEAFQEGGLDLNVTEEPCRHGGGGRHQGALHTPKLLLVSLCPRHEKSWLFLSFCSVCPLSPYCLG